jgi:hypothetical protein
MTNPEEVMKGHSSNTPSLIEVEQAIKDAGWDVMWVRVGSEPPYFVRLRSKDIHHGNIYGGEFIKEGMSDKAALLNALTKATQELARVSGSVASLMAKTSAIPRHLLDVDAG